MMDIKDVRGRMQERFGDSGPGFLAAKVDKRWAFRRDIVRNVDGSWSSSKTSFMAEQGLKVWFSRNCRHCSSWSQVDSWRGQEGERQNIHRFQVFYQEDHLVEI